MIARSPIRATGAAVEVRTAATPTTHARPTSGDWATPSLDCAPYKAGGRSFSTDAASGVLTQHGGEL